MSEITITIEGPPIAKARPRFARRGKFVTTFSPQETEEGRWLWEAKQQIKEKLAGPLFVSCLFGMPRPKGHYGTGKNSGNLKTSSPVNHTSKPDIDNLQKWVFDCLNGVAWNDDSQVCEAASQKFYANNPKTIISIKPMELK